MTSATATKQPPAPGTRAKPVTLKLVCGLCVNGFHDRCRRLYVNPATGVIACPCDQAACAVDRVLTCRDCGYADAPEEPLSDDLVCADRLRCHERTESNPLVLALRECQTTRVVDGEVVERPRRAAKLRKPGQGPKPKVGACLCCAEPTKGGLFLPGHDARFVARLANEVNAAEDVATRDELYALAINVQLATCSPALLAKFDKRVGP